MTSQPSILPPLDPGYLPASHWTRAYRKRLKESRLAQPLSLALERPDGTISRFDTSIFPHADEHLVANRRYIERFVKFILWSRGGYRLLVGGNPDVATMLREIYSPHGAQKFDYEFLGTRVYGRTFEVVHRELDDMPAGHESAQPLGRHLDGCRIGFDLGGSDRKCAAVIDGKCVFSEEIAWDPYFETNPQYHYDGINDSLKRAAAHLPRVDAIGGSAAGVYVNNEVRAASLFRGVSPADFDSRIRRIFFDLQKEWGGVPFEVANDGEVTALAGSMSLGENGVLGISMGTSVAAGYVTMDGSIMPWLNELAFIPVDYRSDAPLDEWSGDRGCAVQYFCQQGVARLASKAGIEFPEGMKLPERLVEVQTLMADGDPRAAKIYETIGVCFGYTIAQIAEFYDFNCLLILGRATSGEGGEKILHCASEVLRAEFPEVAERIKLRIPDEKDKRLGQAVAAASLPAIAR
jgi:predicted NBD/HSP70 family sugar kinase